MNLLFPAAFRRLCNGSRDLKPPAEPGQQKKRLNGNSLAFVALFVILAACQPVPTTPTEPDEGATPTLTPGASATLQASSTLTATSTPIPVTLTPETIIPELCSPLASDPLEKLSGIITQPFIMPRVMDDGSYKDDAHHGVDLGYYTRPDGALFTGTPALAALPGQIAAIVRDRPPYGNAVIVETPFEKIPAHVIQNQAIPAGNSLYTLYAHLQNLQTLEIGQQVTCGQQVAETGLTGFTGGPHLHFETRWGAAGKTFPDGMAYYRADTTEAERANYQGWRMSGQFHLFDPIILFTLPQPDPNSTPTVTP